MVIIYTFASIAGFALSSVAGRAAVVDADPLSARRAITVGASAAIFGLLGAAVYYGRRSGSSHARRGSGFSTRSFMGIFGLIFQGVDNYAHAGGFIGGYLTSMILDPLKPERVDHMVIAAACLLASLIAIIGRVVTVTAAAASCSRGRTPEHRGGNSHEARTGEPPCPCSFVQ